MLTQKDNQEILNLLHKLDVYALQLADSANCAEECMNSSCCLEEDESTLSWFRKTAMKKLSLILSLLDQLDISQVYPFSRCDMAKGKPSDAVKVKLTPDGQVIFHFPHLPGKSTKPTRVKKAYDKRNTIGSAVLEGSKRCGRPVPVYKYYRMSFYHVYPSGQCVRFLKDNDNYDYKHCIDAITDSLGVTDDALRCQLTMATYLSDEIAPGTYCVVSDIACPMLDEDDLLRLEYKGEKSEPLAHFFIII